MAVNALPIPHMRSLTDQMLREVSVPVHPQRIISLVPSQTELLFDLGLGDRVVGITKFCIHPEEWFRTKARVGGTKNVHVDKVRALKPDLIIGNKEENERKDIQELEKEFPVWMSDVRHLAGAVNMIAGIGEITGTLPTANGILRKIADAFGTLEPLPDFPTVAYFIWRDPLMVTGGDTFISDMLSRCGLLNVFAGHAERYVEITPQELATADPDVILLSSEPFPIAEKHLAEFNMMCPGTPVFLVDGEMFSWYGSRLAQAPAYFNGLIARIGGWTGPV